jgi:hypothetical protein
VLNFLSLFAAGDRPALKRVEEEFQLPEGESAIERIARIILGMKEGGDESSDSGRGGNCYWVDAFNTSEVLEGLVSYSVASEGGDHPADPDLRRRVDESIYSAIRFLENHQTEGTWGGVADTCGTLFGYLRVTNTMRHLSPEDHIVFQALRWMCDEKQALSDGSFLHTSYVTVFYLNAIVSAYRFWDLGKLKTTEVYDVALWKVPAHATAERTKRLELELKLEDVGRALEIEANARMANSRILSGVVFFLIQMFLLSAVLASADIVSFDFSNLNINILDRDALFNFGSVAIPVVLVATPWLSALYVNRMRPGKA